MFIVYIVASVCITIMIQLREVQVKNDNPMQSHSMISLMPKQCRLISHVGVNYVPV